MSDLLAQAKELVGLGEYEASVRPNENTPMDAKEPWLEHDRAVEWLEAHCLQCAPTIAQALIDAVELLKEVRNPPRRMDAESYTKQRIRDFLRRIGGGGV